MSNEMIRRELPDGTRIIENEKLWIQRRSDMVCICPNTGVGDEEQRAECPGCVPVADLLYLLAMADPMSDAATGRKE